jgi:hypothetical protein
MSKIAVFVHIGSMHDASLLHLGGKIDYTKYIEFLKPVGELVKVKFYTHGSTPAGFIKALQFAELGEIMTGTDEVAFTMDIMETCFGDDPIDKVILGTSELSHIPIIRYLQKANMPVIVCSPRPSPAFPCDKLPISHSMLHNKYDRRVANATN